ncbi:Single-stranded DNA-binding protein 3 [Galemys pyrenaicus]|uniref:Single-stranded DNA-binding protein 3 n=1 Tax=Galemys pyrenaicus TaxID=202257 RepID=A0A8J6ACH5_GALPY|nr:Single-stranded DNA-binding protein 3 [Galemys pyrenaicus]
MRLVRETELVLAGASADCSVTHAGHHRMGGRRYPEAHPRPLKADVSATTGGHTGRMASRRRFLPLWLVALPPNVSALCFSARQVECADPRDPESPKREEKRAAGGNRSRRGVSLSCFVQCELQVLSQVRERKMRGLEGLGLEERQCRLLYKEALSAAAAPSPVLGNIPPNDGMPGGPIPPGFFQLGTAAVFSGCSGPNRDRGAGPPTGSSFLQGPHLVLPTAVGGACTLCSFSCASPCAVIYNLLYCLASQGPPGSQPSPHAQPPPHNPSSMMGPHSQCLVSLSASGRSSWDTAPAAQFHGPHTTTRWAGQGGPAPLLYASVSCHLTVHLFSHTGHPNMGGSMQRMNPPRGMGPMGPGPQNYGSGMRPPPNSLGPAMPGINMGPGAGRPWPNPNSANSIPYSSSSPGTYVGPPGGGGPPGTPIMPSPADSTNSSDNIYTMINPVPPGGSRSNFPMGPGSDGPMGGMGGMEPHHMNGSLGSGDIDGLPKNSPNNISGISNPPGTPRDDGELGGNFLHSFQNDNVRHRSTLRYSRGAQFSFLLPHSWCLFQHTFTHRQLHVSFPWWCLLPPTPTRPKRVLTPPATVTNVFRYCRRLLHRKQPGLCESGTGSAAVTVSWEELPIRGGEW